MLFVTFDCWTECGMFRHGRYGGLERGRQQMETRLLGSRRTAVKFSICSVSICSTTLNTFLDGVRYGEILRSYDGVRAAE